LPQTGVDDPTYYFESLGYMVPDRPFDPYYAEFLPTRRVDARPHVHAGYEFLYLLEGELEIRHGCKAHILEPGDGVYFDANTIHSYRCVSKTSAISIIVTIHQQRPSQSPVVLRPLDSPVGSRSIPPEKSIPA
jgi:mannose-6-phosphate isomerase-like protein (cupin superfamily)